MSYDFSKIKEQVPQILIAGDVPLYKLKPIIHRLGESPDVIGYKIGPLTLGGKFSLEQAVQPIHEEGKLAVFDMQKMGKDVPFIVGKQAELFANYCDVVICDPKTSEHWEKAYDSIDDQCAGMITVLYMSDEGGTYSLGQRIALATEISVNVEESGRKLENVVLPANQLDVTGHFLSNLSRFGIYPLVWGPGIGKQGGAPYDAGKNGVDIGIVGRLIHEAKDKPKAASGFVQLFRKGYENRSFE